MKTRFLALLLAVASPLASTGFAHPSHDADDLTTPVVSAAVELLPAPQVSIEVRNGYRYITANGIPSHPTGRFPGPGNPNAIRAQEYKFRVPAEPKASAGDRAGERRPRAEGPQLFGAAVNGVPFDPGTAEFWRDDRRSGWRMEAIGGPRKLGLDKSNGHVQPNGAYHYHGIPYGLIEKLAGNANARKMVLVGWAADGFPIYGPYAYDKSEDAKSSLRLMKPSYRLKQSDRPGGNDGPGGKPDGSYTRDWEFAPGSGDLDECNGRTGVTPEFPSGTYYYVLTDAFPFVPRLFHGEVDPSFTKPRGPGGGPGGGRGGPGRGRPPRA
jgi:hypothetical protein